jgi:hypothetical protein
MTFVETVFCWFIDCKNKYTIDRMHNPYHKTVIDEEKLQQYFNKIYSGE